MLVKIQFIPELPVIHVMVSFVVLDVAIRLILTRTRCLLFFPVGVSLILSLEGTFERVLKIGHFLGLIGTRADYVLLYFFDFFHLILIKMVDGTFFLEPFFQIVLQIFQIIVIVARTGTCVLIFGRESQSIDFRNETVAEAPLGKNGL